ncbi:uncharacterized protein CC84DRAFT_125246 [Paraphaeosphaeria sporulosa]|uniref:Secreted protein n=1 Tax=Paraphaeosphaeria sporulosa TaxID=1460663 RepID=A0A177CYA2_9PLEO|nr:uncharacterized protein CC84DRAFT_125246 [Paraphaeosphaeria sporulosa]OAG12545.1 hypothetical protein CC84DRAFT_125246 [Paraphaeosphaeria sporulosa]
MMLITTTAVFLATPFASPSNSCETILFPSFCLMQAHSVAAHPMSNPSIAFESLRSEISGSVSNNTRGRRNVFTLSLSLGNISMV